MVPPNGVVIGISHLALCMLDPSPLPNQNIHGCFLLRRLWEYGPSVNQDLDTLFEHITAPVIFVDPTMVHAIVQILSLPYFMQVSWLLKISICCFKEYVENSLHLIISVGVDQFGSKKKFYGIIPYGGDGPIVTMMEARALPPLGSPFLLIKMVQYYVALSSLMFFISFSVLR